MSQSHKFTAKPAQVGLVILKRHNQAHHGNIVENQHQQKGRYQEEARVLSAFRTIEFVRPAVELRRVGMGVFQHALDTVFHLHLGKGTGTGTVV